jgi:D-cysteine desulfhydrase
MSLAYPARLSLAQLPTPLQPLSRLSAELGGRHRIWIKRDDLTESAISGNKLRKLEFVMAAVQGEGADTVVTSGGIQSNHCRATALVGARLGLNVHLILRGEQASVADGNLLLDYLAGARVSCYPRRQFSAELAQLYQHWRSHYESSGHCVFDIPVGASDGIGIWGYIAAAEELAQDLKAAGIDHAQVICASGSGGTQAGLTLGSVLHQVPADVWGVNVCDDEAWFLDKVAADVADWQHRYAPVESVPALPVRVIDGYVGPGYGRAGPEVYATIHRLAALEGVVLDPVYTGKAFHGMLQELERGRFGECRDIVFLHTGGIFGLFPLRDKFQLSQ